ncbi:MAG: type II toxin-antitoxin system ParD family antitoxin [Beijerinckiaceae bacterium]
MPNVSLGSHFETFIDDQLRSGRFQNASEVVRAGLRLLEDQELVRSEREAVLKAAINDAFLTGGPDIPVDDVMKRIEARYADDMRVRLHGA